MSNKIIFIVLSAVIFIIALNTAYNRNQTNLQKTYSGTDIAAIWKEGSRICNFENPYSRITAGKKYKPPTYFPGFYYFSCVLDKITGGQGKAATLKLWSYINTSIYLLIGLFFYLIFIQAGNPLLALIISIIWFFGRWSFHTLASLQTNFIAIAPLLLSIYFLPKKQNLSFLLFGISLAFKQIAVFLLPLFLIYNLSKPCLKTISKRLLLILIIPFLITLPFLLDDFQGVLQSLLYSSGRASAVPAEGRAIDPGLRSLVMLLSFALIYYAYYKRQLGFAMSAMLIMLTFAGLHKVFFTQYYLWVLSIILITIYEHINQFKLKKDG